MKCIPTKTKSVIFNWDWLYVHSYPLSTLFNPIPSSKTKMKSETLKISTTTFFVKEARFVCFIKELQIGERNAMVEIFLTFFPFSISLTQHYFCWTKAKAYVSLTYCSTHIFRYRRFRSSIMRSWKVLKWYCILHHMYVYRYHFCLYSYSVVDHVKVYFQWSYT